MSVGAIVFLFCLFVPSYSVFSDSVIDAQFYLAVSENQCFFFNVKNSRTDIDVVVIPADDTQMTNVNLYSPHDHRLLHSSKEIAHSFSYPNISGTPHDIGYYQICIENSAYTRNKITLHVSMHNDDGTSVDDSYLDVAERIRQNFASLERFDQITRNIGEKLKAVRSEQRIRSAIERVDRTHIEEAFEKINKYGFLHTFVMISTALIQVAVIRSILSEDSKVGGFLRKTRYSHSY